MAGTLAKGFSLVTFEVGRFADPEPRETLKVRQVLPWCQLSVAPHGALRAVAAAGKSGRKQQLTKFTSCAPCGAVAPRVLGPRGEDRCARQA